MFFFLHPCATEDELQAFRQYVTRTQLLLIQILLSVLAVLLEFIFLVALLQNRVFSLMGVTAAIALAVMLTLNRSYRRGMEALIRNGRVVRGTRKQSTLLVRLVDAIEAERQHAHSIHVFEALHSLEAATDENAEAALDDALRGFGIRRVIAETDET